MKRALSALICVLMFGAPAYAQATAAPSTTTHSFWDRTNLVLFGGVTAGRAVDYTSTRHFRARGVNEWLLNNRIVDDQPLFVGIELAGVAASIGVSYLLHRTGHHTLERWVSVVHFGVSAGGAARNYTLGPSQPGPGVLLRVP